MKTALLTATVLLLGALSSQASAAVAAPVPSMDPRGLYTCANKGLSRVALAEAPHECCTGLLGCPQLLANTGALRTKRFNRT